MDGDHWDPPALGQPVPAAGVLLEPSDGLSPGLGHNPLTDEQLLVPPYWLTWLDVSCAGVFQ